MIGRSGFFRVPQMPKPRACDGCGDVYYRRQLVEVWEVRSIGGTVVWVKTRMRLCVKKCSKPEDGARVLRAAHILPRVIRAPEKSA